MEELLKMGDISAHLCVDRYNSGERRKDDAEGNMIASAQPSLAQVERRGSEGSKYR